MGLKNEFETAVVNEPSVFEPLKVYCIYRRHGWSKLLVGLASRLPQNTRYSDVDVITLMDYY